MAHIIEVVRETAGEARSFLDALFYSDSVSAIGHRRDGELTGAVAVNWDTDEESETDGRISQMISDALEAGNDDDVDAHRSLLPSVSRNRSLSAGNRGFLIIE